MLVIQNKQNFPSMIIGSEQAVLRPLAAPSYDLHHCQASRRSGEGGLNRNLSKNHPGVSLAPFGGKLFILFMFGIKNFLTS